MRYVLTIALAVLVAGQTVAADAKPKDLKTTSGDFKADFEFAWQQIATNYAYLDDKHVAWQDVPTLYKDDLQKVVTRTAFIDLMEHVIDEIYDAHAQLNVNNPTSFRLVPSGADIWAEWRDGQATIIEVRPGTDADRAGLKPNSIVVAINDASIDAAVESRLGRTYAHTNPAARDWALRVVLAGRHNVARVLKVREGATERTIELPARDQFGIRDAQPVSHSIVRPGVGLIRLNDSLGNDGTIAAFDRALNELRGTRSLMIDLRNTASGGNSSVARAILGRFVTRDMPYQKHVLPTEERETGIKRSWLELVSPRGEFTYQGAVVVLVDHWTGSMGEGLAIGFDATDRATVVGTAMAQLIGATDHIALPHTGIGMNIPTERLYHVNGTPREAYRPKVIVDVTKANSAEDPFIAAALRVLSN
jgi:carboxyl-terminal processing protease